MVSRSRETGTDDGLLTPVHNRFTHRPRGCSRSRIPGGCQAVPHAPAAGKGHLGLDCRGRRMPQGAMPAPSCRGLRGRTAKRAADGRSAALAIPVLARLLAPAGQLPVPLDGLDPPPAHRNRDEGPVFDDQARAMSLRGAWSLLTLPTTRHRCRCVFSQATATSMPPCSFGSEFQPGTRRSRSSPLHRRTARPDRRASRSRDEDG